MPHYPNIEIFKPPQEDRIPGNSPTGYPAPGPYHPTSPGRSPYGNHLHPGAYLPPPPMGSSSPIMHPHPASGWPNAPMSPNQDPARGRPGDRYAPSSPHILGDTPSISSRHSTHRRRKHRSRTRRSASTFSSPAPNASPHRALLADPPSSPRSDIPAPVIPPVIPGDEYGMLVPYAPARLPVNAGHVQAPPWAYHAPGEYPRSARPHVNVHVSTTGRPDTGLDVRYQITGGAYLTSPAQQQAPAHGYHDHNRQSWVSVSTSADVGVVQVTVQTQPARWS